ncbi:MAG TPA: phosphohistidine phosphatase SixA [Verrucomicrobiae bacterium]
MNIYILRHGIAEDREEWNKNDSLRPLAVEGEKQLQKIAKVLKKMELEFDLILSSPYERAKKTAEIVAQKLELKGRLRYSDELRCGGDPSQLISHVTALKPLPGNLLLVGHEPYLSQLIALLVSGDPSLEIDFKKAGLCKLKTEHLQFGRCARLSWLLTPKQMELMA